MRRAPPSLMLSSLAGSRPAPATPCATLRRRLPSAGFPSVTHGLPPRRAARPAPLPTRRGTLACPQSRDSGPPRRPSGEARSCPPPSPSGEVLRRRLPAASGRQRVALPDALLLLVLACLGSTAKAARTSSVARRWRPLWTELDVLVFRRVDPDTLAGLLARARHPNLRRLEI
ncbi:hypothetical protein PAHAL_9G073700 [Panicum hallii]|uniref:F-box domain-containing protein n=1 Tax=Panicum hallii TaxID=206008 RepID=A0A2T8I0G4_9POAL|nr:hypothetical protein PAHAL_9G073700 [Panicum hallii]